MKKSSSIIVFLLFPFLLISQQYFNERYDYTGYPEVMFNIVEIDSGYLAIGGMNDSDLYNQIAVIYIDTSGNEVWKKNYGTQFTHYFAGGPGSLIKLNGGGYAMGGGIKDNGNSDAMLFRFNDSGDTLWTKSYGDSSWQTGKQCKQTLDGGFIIVGGTEANDPDGDYWLIKTDSLGNVNGTLLMVGYFTNSD